MKCKEVLVTNILDARSDKPRPRSPVELLDRSKPALSALAVTSSSFAPGRAILSRSRVRSGSVQRDRALTSSRHRRRSRRRSSRSRPSASSSRSSLRKPRRGGEGPDGLRPRILPRRVVLERHWFDYFASRGHDCYAISCRGQEKATCPRACPWRPLVEHPDDVTAFCASLETPCARGAFFRGTRGATGDVSAKFAGAHRARACRVRAADGQRSDGAKISREEFHRQR